MRHIALAQTTKTSYCSGEWTLSSVLGVRSSSGAGDGVLVDQEKVQRTMRMISKMVDERIAGAVRFTVAQLLLRPGKNLSSPE